MTPVLSAVYDELVRRANGPPWVDTARAWVDDFLERTGRFAADHPRAEQRLAAAWEDALCRGAIANAVVSRLEDPAERELASLIPRAHRGIFSVEVIADRRVLHDHWSGAAFLLVARDTMGRSLGDSGGEGLFQGRLVAAADGCAVLPGAVFHDLGATEPMARVIEAAQGQGLHIDAVSEALLRMDFTVRTMSRARAAYAYRVEALGREGPAVARGWQRPSRS